MSRKATADWTTDLTAFRARVGDTVVRIQNEGYLTEDQANALLVRLGLPPESKFKATFNVQARQTITRRLSSGTVGGAEQEATEMKSVIGSYMSGYNWEIDPDSVEFTVVDQASEIKETAEPGHDTTDYETYKKLVRRVGVREAVAHDWCDTGVSRYFDHLGLAPRVTVPVAVTTTTIQRIHAALAEDTEEAVRAVREGRVDEAVQRSMGRQIKVESYTPVDVDAVTVGDGDPTNAYGDTRCNARSKGFFCTRERGHGGTNHVAGNGITVVSVWPVSGS